MKSTAEKNRKRLVKNLVLATQDKTHQDDALLRLWGAAVNMYHASAITKIAEARELKKLIQSIDKKFSMPSMEGFLLSTTRNPKSIIEYCEKGIKEPKYIPVRENGHVYIGYTGVLTQKSVESATDGLANYVITYRPKSAMKAVFSLAYAYMECAKIIEEENPYILPPVAAIHEASEKTANAARRNHNFYVYPFVKTDLDIPWDYLEEMSVGGRLYRPSSSNE